MEYINVKLAKAENEKVQINEPEESVKVIQNLKPEESTNTEIK